MTNTELKKWLRDNSSGIYRPSRDAADYVQRLEDALSEIVRRSNLMIHQNTGRWDVTIEHDKRSFNVTNGNVRIAQAALANTKMRDA